MSNIFSSHPRPDPAGPGQESVWDYPRPPRLEPTARHLLVVLSDTTIADTTRGYRVLETSHPPNYYFPPEDIAEGALERTKGTSFCEFKGRAHYFNVKAGSSIATEAAWAYDSPSDAFGPIAGYVAFYASRMDECYVDDELVTPQPGGFYGGWITEDIAGPYKGGPGSRGW